MGVKFAQMIEADFAIMHKTRPAHDVASVTEVTGHVRGKVALVGDDVIMTGRHADLRRAGAARGGCDRRLRLRHARDLRQGRARALRGRGRARRHRRDRHRADRPASSGRTSSPSSPSPACSPRRSGTSSRTSPSRPSSPARTSCSEDPRAARRAGQARDPEAVGYTGAPMAGERIRLEVRERDASRLGARRRRLRRAGIIPGVLYGRGRTRTRSRFPSASCAGS